MLGTSCGTFLLPEVEYFHLSPILVLVQCKHQNENQVAADPDAGKYEQPGPMIMEVMIFRIFYLSSTLRNYLKSKL